jgi:SAM-dependent methyltransferase
LIPAIYLGAALEHSWALRNVMGEMAIPRSLCWTRRALCVYVSLMTERFLDRVYDARTADETETLYNKWAASYEDEVAEHGYVTPERCAKALAAQMPDQSRPILDFGCGTGLSGLALKLAGFAAIDGVDLSADMLKGARAKGVYRNLRQIKAGTAPTNTPGEYDAIAAIGVIGAGAAPIDTFDLLMNCLAPTGLFVLSFNDHALSEPENESRLQEWIDHGKAKLLFKEYGEHLPGLGLKSNVYVVQKT